MTRTIQERWAKDQWPVNPFSVNVPDNAELGGPGSGHFDHKGRPGHQGGSLPSQYIAAVRAHEGVMENPFDPRVLAFMTKTRDDIRANLELTDFTRFMPNEEPAVEFNITVPQQNRRKGYGNEVMRELMALADKIGVTLVGQPGAYGVGKKMTTPQLTKWYVRLGFVEENGRVVYRPKPVSEFGGPGSGHYGHEGRPGQVGGSLPSDVSGVINEIIKPSAEKAVKIADAIMQVHQHGQKTGNEMLVMLDKNGDNIGEYTGNQTGVAIAPNNINERTYVMANAETEIHNHPWSISFSDDDINAFFHSSARNSIVIAANGDIYVMVKPEGWKNVPSGNDWKRYYFAAGDLILPKYNADTAAGMPTLEATMKWTHPLVEDFSKRMGLKYWKFQYGVDYGKR